MSKIIHVAPWMETTDPRILRARDTWEVLYKDYGWKGVRIPWGYEPFNHDLRKLTPIKPMLDWADTHAVSPDILVLTCDDVVLRPCIDQQVRELSARCVFFTGHRVNCDTFGQALQQQEITEVSNGRVLIGCRCDQWPEFADYLPDLYCGTGQGDLYIAALARKLAGKGWTQETDNVPEPACELIPGCIWHERHKPSWDESMPADIRDKKLTAEAFRTHLPEMLPPYLKDL